MMKIVNKLDEKHWREFVSENPQGNIFHTPEMFQVFTRAKRYQPELRAVVGENGQVLAMLLPVLVTLRDGLFRRLTSRSIAYGSVLCDEGRTGKEALSILLSDYVKKSGRKSLFTELRHLSDLSAFQSTFSEHGFEYEDHLNYLVDLTATPEEIFSKFTGHARKHIRHETKKGQIAIEEVRQRSQVKIVYDLLKKSYTNARVPCADISLFEAAFDVLSPLNMVKFWLARVGDTFSATSVELIYKDVIYGWYGGVDRAFSPLAPNELLTWHVLKWGAENGYRIYDFGGAGKPDEKYGVRDFKAKFGGRQVCYGRNLFVPAPVILRASEMGYHFLRRFMVR